MSAVPKREDPCRVSRSVGAYADGELEPSRAVEVEQHLAVCRSCREEVELIASMRRSLRRSATRAATPSTFAERMQALAALEIAKAPAAPSRDAVEARSPKAEPAAKESGPRLRARLSWAVTVAVAAAAGFVVAFLGSKSDKALVATGLKVQDPRPMVSVSHRGEVDDRREAFESLIDRLVTFHANPLPSEVDDIDDAVKRFEPYVGVHMRGTSLRRPAGAKFNGGRIYDIEFPRPASSDTSANRRYTAEFRYTMQGHRVTVYVFDSHAMPIRASRLKPRVVQSLPVYVGRVRGFSVVAAEKSGIGYAMASDFDDDSSAKLVSNFD